MGGGIGENLGFVSACSASGRVLGHLSVGGLIGSNQGRVQACHASAEVTAVWQQAGGLIGRHDGHVAASYATGDVMTYGIGGGLVGESVASVPVAITSCYSRSSVASKGGPQRGLLVGGLVGYDRPSSSASNPVFVENGYFLALLDGGGPDNQVGLSLTGIEMTQQASFAGWDFWGDAADGPLEDWFMPAEGAPLLPWQVIPDVVGLPLDDATDVLDRAGLSVGHIASDTHRSLPANAVITVRSGASMPASIDLVVSTGALYDWTANPGDGSAENPYQIGQAGQLESLGGHPELLQQHFVLTDDLDMSGRTYRTALIAPDVNRVADGFQGTAFTGRFDGQGHAIINLEIVSIDLPRDYLGLFGSIGPGGHVQDLTLFGAHITGNLGNAVGALAGSVDGTLNHVFATGTILGQSDDAASQGLVGTADPDALQDAVSEVVVITRSRRINR